MAKLQLSKFDVAERQLLQAITMFFREEDPVSIHTLAEAASQVLRDIGAKYGATSFLRDSELIREERKKEWLYHVNKSKNFFKHADRDPEETHEFNTVTNDYVLMDAVMVYASIKKQWVPETAAFDIWLGLEHPNLLVEGTEYQRMFSEAVESGNLPREADKSLMAELVKQMRSGKLQYGHVSLEYGL